MVANTSPIFALSGDVSNNGTTGMNQMVTAAANDYTGIDADVSLVWTAGSNGGYVKGIKFKSGGTNVASVARIYFNNGSAATTATNNTFFAEVSLPATTAIATAATAEIYLPIELALPASFRVYFGLGTAVAAGWCANVIGGQY